MTGRPITLKRDSFGRDGVLGELFFTRGDFIAYTLEHAYEDGIGNVDAKLPPGTYRCVRGTHRLKDGIPFETFEITDVPGHTGILFHPGNRNEDSDGCVLIGMNRLNSVITNSREAFKAFMDLNNGVNEFWLEVL